MVVTVHIAELRPRAAAALLLRPPRPERVPGLDYAVTATTAPLGEPLLPPRQLSQVGMIAAWESDAAFDRFCGEHPLAAELACGWQVRLQPLRVFGSWAGLDGLPSRSLAVAEDEPVGILTLGRLRLLRTSAFRRSAAPAEAAALADPALLAGIGLARLPSLVATFSLWHGAGAMRRYATADGGPHRSAIQADRERAFHRESAFVRFRPYASRGRWNGRDPVDGLGDSVAAEL